MDKIFKTAELLAQHREGYINGILSENPKLKYTDAANTWLILKLAEIQNRLEELESR